MAIYPKAKKCLLPESSTQPKIIPRIIVDHTQAGSNSVYGLWQSSGLESHFWISRTGLVEQYMDTEVQADANFKANRFLVGNVAYGAVSIETENSPSATQAAYHGGKGSKAFDVDPWTDAQLKALIALHEWLAVTHPKIKRQACDAPFGSGLGYHSMWGTGPTDWIPAKSKGKTCPGTSRIAQHQKILLPAFTKSTGTSTGPFGAVKRAWRPINPGDTDASIAKAGGLTNEVSEIQQILTHLKDRWKNKAFDPKGVNGTYGPSTQAAISAFKARIIEMQKANGSTPWPNTDAIVGKRTISSLRWWDQN